MFGKKEDCFFVHVLKCIKWQDLLEEEKMDAMRFERVHRLILEKYNYFGVRGTLGYISFL